MAFMNQERKKELAPRIKAVLKKYGLKGSLRVEHYSTLVLTIREGAIDFHKLAVKSDYGFNHQVNPYWIDTHWNGIAAKAINELKEAMMVGNHDNSDIMTDYFDVGWYISINIGTWNKPYKYVGEAKAA